LLKFQSKEECSKMNLIESMAPVRTPRMPVFLLYRTVTTGGIILRVGTTQRVQEGQDENVWKIGYAPLATMATRTSYAIYPRDRSRRKTPKRTQNHNEST
jgi:hypothetical protein